MFLLTSLSNAEVDMGEDKRFFIEDFNLETVKLELTTSGVTLLNKLGRSIYPKENALTLLYHGKVYIPDKYMFGLPYFSGDDESSLWKEIISNKDNDPDYNIYQQVAKICYLPETDFLEDEDFNSADNIEKSLSSYEDFYNILRKRKAYYDTTRNYNKEFLINGVLYLDVFGQVEKCSFDSKIDFPKVVAKEDLEKYLADVRWSRTMAEIPNPKETCKICGKKFELSDILSGNTIKRIESNDEFDYYSHEDCYYKKVRKENEEYILDCISSVFEKNDCAFKEIPNEYGCNCKLCQNRPWFVVTTAYGKIKLGARKRVDSITFYKEGKFGGVNFAELFKGENVTKSESRIDFTIHAWSKYDVIKYLKMVKDACDESQGEE